MIINYIGAFLLIVIGLALIIFKKNLIKIVIGMGVMDSGINLLLITIGFRAGGTAPIFISDLKDGAFFVDPIPQALTLTSIVIGACVTALALYCSGRYMLIKSTLLGHSDPSSQQ